MGLSLILHSMLLIILALIVVPVAREEDVPELTTVLDDAGDKRVIFDQPIDTDMSTPAPGAVGFNMLDSKLLEPTFEKATPIPNANVGKVTSIIGEEGGGGDNGAGVQSGRISEPRNAVRAGSYSVWAQPIKGGRLIGGKLVLGEAGAAPKVSQDYFIVIRLKVPAGRSRVSISDLSGMVIGTDGYRQLIPDEAYFYSTQGQLMRAGGSNRIVPIIDGTVEILIRVPGADIPQVRDTITVHSKMLDERQELELVFEALEEDSDDPDQ